jgi:serine/threonine-protein kinase HipA
MSEKKKSFDQLHLWYLGNPTQPQYVGTLDYLPVGKGASLTYTAQWIDGGFPLSADMPLSTIEHSPKGKGMAVGAVDDARPDRWGERIIQYLDRPARLSVMEYLYYAGDDRFGALGISTSAKHYLPRSGGPLPRLEDAQTMSQIIAKIKDREPITDIEQRMVRTGGSLGGAKPKALIDVDGDSWLIKFFNNEPVDAPLVEHASMTLAAQAGIRVAATRALPLCGEHAVVVRRFDRLSGQRIHTISAGTALRAVAISGELADLSYFALAQELRRAGDIQHSASDMQELFRRMVFNILIDNTDDHEKNHALQILEPRQYGRIRLSPAYDVLPTNSGQGHQELIVGEDGPDSTLANAMSKCELFGLSKDQAANEVIRVIAVVDGWRAHFKKIGVSDGDIEQLVDRIDGDELRPQRIEFKPPRPSNPKAKGFKKHHFK